MKKFVGTLKCADCGEVLNTTNPLDEREQRMATMFSALAAGSCPKGCRATLSDLNINTKLTWQEVDVGEG